MKALILTEFYKLIKQSRTYYAIGAVLLIEIIILFVAFYQGKTIIDVLLKSLQDSFYFEGTLLNGNLIIYMILNSLWFHLPLILMIIVSGMLTVEYKDGTLQSVMLQPVSKWKFMTAKYIVAIVFTLTMVLIMAITAFVLSYGLFGKGDLVVYLNGLIFFTNEDAFIRLIEAFASGAVSMVFFSVVSLTLAVVFKEGAKTWIISALFLIISNLFLNIDLKIEWLNRIFFAKLNDTWQFFFYSEIDWNRIYWNNFLLIVYILIFMVVGVYIFNKKDIGT